MCVLSVESRSRHFIFHNQLYRKSQECHELTPPASQKASVKTTRIKERTCVRAYWHFPNCENELRKSKRLRCVCVCVED